MTGAEYNHINDVIQDLYQDGKLGEEEFELLCACTDAKDYRDKYKWHDLRKNPDDLPKENCKQYICFEEYWNPNEEQFETGFVIYWFVNGRFSTIGLMVEVIAWKEIEPYEEAE